MKIALTIGSLGLGGAERQLAELAKQLHLRHEITVIYFNSLHEQLRKEIVSSGIRTICFQPMFKLDPAPTLKLANYLRKNKIELIHSFLFTAGYISRIAAVIAQTQVVIHGERMGLFNRKLWRVAIDRILAAATNHFIANSQTGKEYLVKKLCQPSSKVSVIYNAVDTSRFKKQNRKNDNVVVMVGRLWPEKNYPTALKVIEKVRKSVPDAKMKIAGDIGMATKRLSLLHNKLMSYTKKHNLTEAVEWLGFNRNVPFLLATSAVYLSTSLHEGCQNSMLEAMAAGIPVVVPKISDNPSIVRHGIDGYLVEDPNDIDSFSRHIIQLLNSPPLRQNMGDNARKQIQQFTPARLAEKHEELYSALLLGALK